MIPQIAPGEAFALYATVTIPQYLSDQELVNEVTVVTEETGSQTMKSQSNVTLTTNENTVTATPQPTEMALQLMEEMPDMHQNQQIPMQLHPNHEQGMRQE